MLLAEQSGVVVCCCWSGFFIQGSCGCFVQGSCDLGVLHATVAVLRWKGVWQRLFRHSADWLAEVLRQAVRVTFVSNRVACLPARGNATLLQLHHVCITHCKLCTCAPSLRSLGCRCYTAATTPETHCSVDNSPYPAEGRCSATPAVLQKRISAETTQLCRTSGKQANQAQHCLPQHSTLNTQHTPTTRAKEPHSEQRAALEHKDTPPRTRLQQLQEAGTLLTAPSAPHTRCRQQLRRAGTHRWWRTAGGQTQQQQGTTRRQLGKPHCEQQLHEGGWPP